MLGEEDAGPGIGAEIGVERGVAGGTRGRDGIGPRGMSASGLFLSWRAGAGVVGTAGDGSSGVDFTLEEDEGRLPFTF